jgi:hypothetical protein
MQEWHLVVSRGPESAMMENETSSRFSNALLEGRRPVKDHRISFEKTLARF